MKCHVQIPSSILRGFASNKQQSIIYKYNVSGACGYESIKGVNIIEDYYSKDVEDRITDIETRFGIVKKRIIDAFNKKRADVFKGDDFSIIYDLIMISMMRNPEVKDAIFKKRNYDVILGKRKQDLLIESYTNYKYLFNKTFGDHIFTFLKNNTSKNFIIPQNVVYFGGSVAKYDIVLPITPKLAILFENPDNAIFLSENQVSPKQIIDENQIDYYNRQAIVQEMASKKADILKNLYAQSDEDILQYDIRSILSEYNQNK